ncbi:hypothetical protein JB92DRAFT_2833754 [Gautieria morchelliformis]|nr:hypothetical protein JB92DRAFT_2833754 [Gautieria morchelliformis]
MSPNTEADTSPSAPSAETGTTAQLPNEASPALKFLAEALGALLQGQSLQQAAIASQQTDLREQLRLQHKDTQCLLAQIGGATTSCSSSQAALPPPTSLTAPPPQHASAQPPPSLHVPAQPLPPPVPLQQQPQAQLSAFMPTSTGNTGADI